MDAAELVKVILCFGFALFCLSAVFYCVFGKSKKAAKPLDEQKKPRKAEKPKEKDPEKEKLADRAALKMQRAMYRVVQGQGYYIREEDGDL